MRYREGVGGEIFWKCNKVKNQKCDCDGIFIDTKVLVRWQKSRKRAKVRGVEPVFGDWTPFVGVL